VVPPVFSASVFCPPSSETGDGRSPEMKPQATCSTPWPRSGCPG
jgi:hypothetical protein